MGSITSRPPPRPQREALELPHDVDLAVWADAELERRYRHLAFPPELPDDPSDPTAEEIAAGCERIQKTWTKKMRQSRIKSFGVEPERWSPPRLE